MQQPLINLATAGLLLCTTFFVWSSLRHLGNNYWTFVEQRPTQDSLQPDEALSIENHQLEQTLREVRTSIVNAPAVTVTTPIEATVTATSDALPQEIAAFPEPTIKSDGFAYLFYVTADPYACSALVNIHRLQQVLKTTIAIHVLASSDVSDAYVGAFRASNVTVHIEQAPQLMNGAGGYYQNCLLKLLAFKMHIIVPGLRRVLIFDSDQLIVQNLDHLFAGLPDVDLAAPRAYWLAKDFLASTFLMINLSDRLWHIVKAGLETVGFDKFDMDLINDLLGDTVMMLSGEYVTLNSHWEDWNLPTWYHPISEMNMTTVKLLNELSKPVAGGIKRAESNSGRNKRQSETDVLEMSVAIPKSGEGEVASSVQQVPARKEHPLTVIPPAQLSPLAPMEPQEPKPALVLNLSPRFPVNHPLTLELYRLQEAAAVIHFTAQGKPWMKTPSTVRAWRPDAHPVLAEQFGVWRKTANEVCPGGTPGGHG